jgi:hypothetical protein
VVNLLAAGGIGFASVALGLWTLVALGLNLREDRPCGRLRLADGRPVAFVIAMVWAALIGSFLGAILPYWRAEPDLELASAALNSTNPSLERAREAYVRASQADRLAVTPWQGLADVERREWLMRGARADDGGYSRALVALETALRLPRNPRSLTIQLRRAVLAREVMQLAGSNLPPQVIIQLKGQWVSASRQATQLYPNSAMRHAELAIASESLGDLKSAHEEAQEALRLDELTPHPDKKLSESLRAELKDQVARWEQRTGAAPPPTPHLNPPPQGGRN